MALPHISPPHVNVALPHITVAPTIIEAVAIIALVFGLVLIMAYMSRSFMSWSLSGAGIGMVVGFLIALLLEGFLILGGKTIITAALGWKNAPAPILSVINTGHDELLNALNVPASCSARLK